jgi:hypothetical protein
MDEVRSLVSSVKERSHWLVFIKAVRSQVGMDEVRSHFGCSEGAIALTPFPLQDYLL